MRYVIGLAADEAGEARRVHASREAGFRHHAEEDGCLFYEGHPSTEDPDLVMLVEGWQTAEQHLAHQKASHHVAFGPIVVSLCVGGRFDEIDASNVVSVTPTF
jgi:quinol monooxygenase YgiN